jgi:thymidylate synthase (FAD)
MSVKLLYVTPDYSKVIEYAARKSTNTDCKDTPEEFVHNLVRRGHLSVGRFVNAEFEVTCSRSCLQQWVRSKFLEFCVMSQRYVNQSNSDFIIPNLDYIKDKRNGQIAHSKLRHAIEDSLKVYKELIELGVNREDARYCLPEAIETKFCVVSNLQGWTSFLKLRTDKKAQWEIRSQANIIKDILLKECPAWFEEIFKGE